MDLLTRFLAARRDKLLMRLGCWLVCFSLVLGLMLPQQRAEALVTELSMTAVASVAAAYLGACGLTFVTQGMDKDALVSSVQRLIQEFLDTELGGISIQDWLVGVWDLVFTGGKLVLGRMLTDKLMEFAQWVAGKYAAQVGENTVYNEQSITFADGSSYVLTCILGLDASNDHVAIGSDEERAFVAGTPIPCGISKSDPFQIQVTSDFSFSLYKDSSSYFFRNGVLSWHSCYRTFAGPLSFILKPSTGAIYLGAIYPDGYYSINFTASNFIAIPANIASDLLLNVDLSVERKHEALIFAPPALAAEQGIALDVGLGAVLSAAEAFEGILDDVLAGTLESTMTAADEKVEPIDPPAGEIADVDDLGLPALGQALTSRFPFSIPWDFFRAVQLLAAPAKAPYFEVDFMEPLADEVGGWKGSTKVVLDFSEYAIIGQISRWTSTIGFCLMLAGATKRLIWTA